MFNYDWTPARVDRLTKLAFDGLSASQIAGELGGITRNAVIGKLNRMGMKAAYSVKSRNQTRTAKPERRLRIKRAPVEIPVIEAPAVEEVADDQSHAVRLIDTEDHHCRWPLGEPHVDMLVCGANKLKGISYCEHHARIAYPGGWE